jgi:NTE family protein
VAPTVHDYLTEGPFTLVLSAGFFGFYAHAGALAAIVEAGLRPARVTGASAGALVGGLFAGGATPDEIVAELRALRREHFWDPAPGAGLLRGRLFQERIRRLMRRHSFEDAHVPAALSTWDVRTRRTVIQRSGDLARAICASCAFPFLLQPVVIDGRPQLDGGIADRPAHASLVPNERVLFHHLPEQSFWRIGSKPVPHRRGMVMVAPPGLPRLGPFRLEEGPRAMAIARDHMRRALEHVLVPRVALVG